MQTYTISALAREFSITSRAIRFYEDQGLLAPTRAGAGGRIRVYSARDRARLTLTLRGRRLGLSLCAIKELLDMYESPHDSHAQARRLLQVLEQHRATLLQQKQDIDAMLDDIARHEGICKTILAEESQPGTESIQADSKIPDPGPGACANVNNKVA